MLLEKDRFTLDGLECNKIGVGYDAFNGQPSFCSSPYGSCLRDQLWNFHDVDKNRISKNKLPLYLVERRFERINEHPTSGSHSFSIGITEDLTTNLLIELAADDIKYVYQRSPGEIIGITVPTFEALTQFGTATVTTKNIGEVESSYSLTFNCSAGVSQMEEQVFIMKPKETISRSFKLYPTSDQAIKYKCYAILKDSGFSEVDRSECQFTTKATIINNGSQVPIWSPEASNSGYFDSINSFFNKIWSGFVDFITSKTCREKCSSLFDVSCHIQYICISWMVMFGVVLAIFLAGVVNLWLLNEGGHCGHLFDWWEDEEVIRRDIHVKKKHRRSQTTGGGIYSHTHHKKHHHKDDRHNKRKMVNNQEEEDMDDQYELHHEQKPKLHMHMPPKHRRNKSDSGADHHHHHSTNNNDADKGKEVNNHHHHHHAGHHMHIRKETVGKNIKRPSGIF